MSDDVFPGTPKSATIKKGKDKKGEYVLDLTYSYKGRERVEPSQYFDTYDECVRKAKAWGAFPRTCNRRNQKRNLSGLRRRNLKPNQMPDRPLPSQPLFTPKEAATNLVSSPGPYGLAVTFADTMRTRGSGRTVYFQLSL